MSVVHEHWSLYRYSFHAIGATGYVFLIFFIKMWLVFICLNIIRSMIREEVDYQIDLSFVGMVDKTGFFKSVTSIN